MSRESLKNAILAGLYDDYYYEFVFEKVSTASEEAVNKAIEDNTYLEDFIEYMENEE